MNLEPIKNGLSNLFNYVKDNFKVDLDIHVDTPITNKTYHVDTTQAADYISSQIENKKRKDAICPIYFFDNKDSDKN